ncbi:MAG: DNA-binding response regulator [Thiotrichaceae bacterium]|nr:MAG: DNA-binding response regulator [Thiotrichaceae bacterium]
MPLNYSVLLIEDDPHTRDLLASIVDAHAQLNITAAVGTYREGLSELEKDQPDVLLVDLGLPDGDGTDLIQEIYRRGYATDAMVITVFGDEKHVVRAIEAGATGYILKDGSNSYIAESIIQLKQGGSPISAPIARYLLNRFHTPAPENKNIELPHLTEREKEVLSKLSRGFNFAEIAEILAISPHTVTSHVKHIYRKLAVRSRSEAVFEAVQLGLIDIAQ